MTIKKLVVGNMDNNCYIITDGTKTAAVIDPGDDFERIKAAVIADDLKVKYTLLTHGHFDHIGAVRELCEYTEAEIVISKQDEELLYDTDKNVGWRVPKKLQKYNLSGLSAAIRVEDGDEIKLGELTVQVIATPGHTQGSVVYKAGDCLFTGDTLFAGSVGIVTHYGGNMQQELESIARLSGMLEGDYKVYPGHGEQTTLERERRTNPYMGNRYYDDCN